MEAFGRLRAAEKMVVPLVALVVVGALGPWLTGVPFRLWEDREAVTLYGYETAGWGIAIPAVLAMGLLVRGREPLIRNGVPALLFLWGAGLSAYFLFSAGLLMSDVEKHWGLPIALVGCIAAALLLGGAALEQRRGLRRLRPNP